MIYIKIKTLNIYLIVYNSVIFNENSTEDNIFLTFFLYPRKFLTLFQKQHQYLLLSDDSQDHIQNLIIISSNWDLSSIFCILSQQQQFLIKVTMNQATPKTEVIHSSFVIADSGQNEDNSCVYLSLQALVIQGLLEGQLLQIACPLRRMYTLAVVFVQKKVAEPNLICMNHICRKNLGAEVGDIVQIKKFTQSVNLSRLVVKKIGGLAPCATSENHQQVELIKYFQDCFRPICLNQIFQIKSKMGKMEFFITFTDPSIQGIVTSETMIAIDWQSDQLTKSQ